MSIESSRVPVDAVRRQADILLQAWGMPRGLAAATSEVLSFTDLSGIDSHGISMMPMYDEMRRLGKLRLAEEPRVVRRAASTALVDAGGSLGHPASIMATELVIEMALSNDIAAISVVNSHHFGAAGYYAEMIAARGLIGLVTSSTRFVSLVPTFGAAPVLGTNPIAFAAPGGRCPPVVLDMATSVVAINKVKLYARRGQALPAGWVVDGEGRPVTDASEALRVLTERPEGGITPVGGGTKAMGGHKGYGLSLMAHILASTLGGASFSPVRNKTQGASDPENIGHFFLALNPQAFRALTSFKSDLDTIVDTLHATPPADPNEPVLVAGDPERLSRAERTVKGIPLPDALKAQIRDLARATNVEYLLG